MEQILNVLRCAGDEAARKAAMDAELGSWVQEVDHTFSAEEQQLIFRTSLQTSGLRRFIAESWWNGVGTSW